jgi:hypothetical protein
MRVLSPAQIEKAFDLNEQLRNVDAVFERVFNPSVHLSGVSESPMS